ncbi:MAG: hypothetical protein KDA52_09025, partial [Planctomycetaceae bacterium]|nr:hypothetical protein [Planctomycetaceae bacterium]
MPQSMTRFALVAVVLLVVAVVTANSFDRPPIPISIDENADVPDVSVEAEAIRKKKYGHQVDQLKDQYLQLMRQKLDGMSQDQLQESVEALISELDQRNRDADASLEPAIEALELTVEKFAGTGAAKRAEVALKVLTS